MAAPLTKQMKVGHMTLAKTLALLMVGPTTTHEISEHIGIHLVTAQEWMRALRKEGTVHIVGWLPDRLDRDCTPVYALGAGKDKPRRKLSGAARAARYRERIRKLSHQKMITGEVL